MHKLQSVAVPLIVVAVPDASSREGWEAAVLEMRAHFAAGRENTDSTGTTTSKPSDSADQGFERPPRFRVFTVSDIHTDSEENRWVEKWFVKD